MFKRLETPTLLIADKRGRVYDVPYLEATGMKGGEFFRLKAKDLVRLHPDSEIFLLPHRTPIGYDPQKGQFIRLNQDPYSKHKDPCYPVAAFVAPGYTATYSASYCAEEKTKILPLFSYAAIAFYKGEFYTTAILVDREKRQALKGISQRRLRKNCKIFKKLFPKNRLIRHLEKCALTYGCPAAKNFFLKRYEAPLPTSPFCNAQCTGCISYQTNKAVPITQPRITFVPTQEEIAEVAIFHIHNVKDPVISFGQGCEGEPLMVGDVLEKAIRLIRTQTRKGIVNLNTNASKPYLLSRLFDAGLDSIRVSINSFQEKYYSRYYKPRGYSFQDVLNSIKLAKCKGRFVSINYLIMPGFTDSKAEVKAFFHFLDKFNVDMIQWRNLNYDPLRYFKNIGTGTDQPLHYYSGPVPTFNNMIGIRELIYMVKKKYPHLMHGYFNPSKNRIQRWRCKMGTLTSTKKGTL